MNSKTIATVEDNRLIPKIII